MDAGVMGAPILREFGALSITDSDYPDAHLNPADNLDHVFFHTDNDYIEIAYEEVATLTFPARGDQWNRPRETQYNLPDHNLDIVSHGMLVIDDFAVPQLWPVYKNGTTVRALALEVTDTEVKIIESHRVDFHGNMPSQTVTVRVFLFAPIEEEPGNNYLLHVDPARPGFSLAKGRITEQTRILQQNDIAPRFYINFGKTSDTYDGGLRLGTPDGNYTDFKGYSHTFVPDGLPVSDIGRTYSDGKIERFENGHISFGDDQGRSIFSTENVMPCILGTDTIAKTTINVPQHPNTSYSYEGAGDYRVRMPATAQRIHDYDLGPAPAGTIDFLLVRSKIEHTDYGNFYIDDKYGGWYFPYDYDLSNITADWRSIYGTIFLQEWNFFRTYRVADLLIDGGRWVFRVTESNKAVSRTGGSGTVGMNNSSVFDVEFEITYGRFMGTGS